MECRDKILVLTPIKNAVKHLNRYLELLGRLTYPHRQISLGLLESDSQDGTYAAFENSLLQLRRDFRKVSLWKKDFGFHIPPGTPRWARDIQLERRRVLARSRNRLLFSGLVDEDWVLWLDVDVVEYPPDILERLLAVKKDILQPHCVRDRGGDTFDLNAWRDRGRYHLNDLRSEGDLVRLDAVGGTMLLVRADLHREGLIFPTFLYGRRNPLVRRRNFASRKTDRIGWLLGRYAGEIETEGLGIMAADMGYECWGMPNLEIRHHDS